LVEKEVDACEMTNKQEKKSGCNMRWKSKKRGKKRGVWRGMREIKKSDK
jgi:hypothetical protein